MMRLMTVVFVIRGGCLITRWKKTQNDCLRHTFLRHKMNLESASVRPWNARE